MSCFILLIGLFAPNLPEIPPHSFGAPGLKLGRASSVFGVRVALVIANTQENNAKKEQVSQEEMFMTFDPAATLALHLLSLIGSLVLRG